VAVARSRDRPSGHDRGGRRRGVVGAAGAEEVEDGGDRRSQPRRPAVVEIRADIFGFVAAVYTPRPPRPDWQPTEELHADFTRLFCRPPQANRSPRTRTRFQEPHRPTPLDRSFVSGLPSSLYARPESSFAEASVNAQRKLLTSKLPEIEAEEFAEKVVSARGARVPEAYSPSHSGAGHDHHAPPTACCAPPAIDKDLSEEEIS